MDGGHFGVHAFANLITRNYPLKQHALENIVKFGQKCDVV